VRFFLDGISPRKYPTPFFLECTAVELCMPMVRGVYLVH
jgi:hypothetical protein